MNLWQINEDKFDPKRLHAHETVYSIGNGYFGTRGSFEESYPKATPATLLFGVFDRIAVGKEELANAPDWLLIKLFVNGERFRLNQGTILGYHRTLDMYNGILRRFVHWQSPTGIRLKIVSERFASLADEHVGAIRYSVTADEQSTDKIDIALWAALNIAVGNYDLMHWETIEHGQDQDLLWLNTQTRHSGMQLVQSMSFTTDTADFQKEFVPSDIAPSIRLRGTLAPGATITAEKLVVMYTSRDTKTPLHAALEHHQSIRQHHSQPSQTHREQDASFAYDGLQEKHQQAWHDYWQMSDIVIEGDDKAQRALRYSLYQLRISVSSHDSRYSFAIARNLVLYRYHLLPGAREKAKENGYEGAQYPWESTLDGSEATPPSIIHPESGELISVLNGTLELHISSNIAHAAWLYWDVTGDNEFMQQYGAEMLLSIATFWGSRVEYHAERHDYEITNVIGPDEWHEHVNNNAYTNYMAKWSIQKALEVLHWLEQVDPLKTQNLTRQLDLSDKRLDHWRDVIEHMYIPQDQQTSMFEQFDNFFNLKPLDQSKYKGRKTSYQALLGMQGVQEHRIIKQADVLMLLTVLDQDFDYETKKANWDYYYPITDHDFGSSLTPALHVILACERGLVDTAYDLFMTGALVDLEDLRLNTAEGVHDACCGAVWQAAILGFAGLRLTDDGYTTHPSWPNGWTRLAFKFCHKGELCSVDLRKE